MSSEDAALAGGSLSQVGSLFIDEETSGWQLWMNGGGWSMVMVKSVTTRGWLVYLAVKEFTPSLPPRKRPAPEKNLPKINVFHQITEQMEFWPLRTARTRGWKYLLFMCGCCRAAWSGFGSLDFLDTLHQLTVAISKHVHRVAFASKCFSHCLWELYETTRAQKVRADTTHFSEQLLFFFSDGTEICKQMNHHTKYC